MTTIASGSGSEISEREVRRERGGVTFGRFTVVYTIAGLLAAAALLVPETTEDPTRYRVIYSIWATTLLLVPTVACFFFADIQPRIRAYWMLFSTAAYAVYLVHFYFAVFVHFGGFGGTIRGQGPWIAGGNFVLTLLWTVDTLTIWTAIRRDYRIRNRHLAALLVIVLAFLFFTVIRNDGVVRWLGLGLAATAVAAPILRLVYGDRLLRHVAPAPDAPPQGPREEYLGGSLEAEAAYFDRFIEQINLVQRRIRERSYPSPVRRAFHAKQQLGVENASFRVVADIANDLQVSLFSEPRTCRATVRLSSAAGSIRPDGKRDLYGIAVRVHVGEGDAHDFLATNAPASHARDAYQFMAVAVAASRRFRFLFPLRLMLSVGPVETARILYVLLRSRRRIDSLATETYWSRSAIRVGETAVRYALVPHNAAMRTARPEDPDYLRKELLAQLRQGDVTFDLVFQRFVDERRTPIEDSSIEWSESVSPPLKVAELTIPQQTLDSAESRAMEARVEQTAFTPWLTDEQLRPLGSQNRARQLVYRSSSDYRLRRKQVERHPWYVSIPVAIGIPLFAGLNRVVDWHRWPLPLLEVLNLDTFRYLLRRRNLYDPAPPPRLRASTRLPEFDATRAAYRQPDGTYNDLADPEMGRAGKVFGRNMPLESLVPPTPRSVLEPNPRTISRRLHARESFVPATTLNLLAASWIQFQVHGWFNHTKLASVFKTSDFWEIDLAADDPWREYEDPMRIPKTPIQGRTRSGIPTFANTETHWWDASQIYGNSDAELAMLRDEHRGYMRLENGLLPLDPRIPVGGFDLTGFVDNYWLGLSMMHTLFVREHNAICDRLIDEFPDRRGDNDWLFHKARLINAALMAKIHTVEWTPAILGRRSLETSMRANWWGVLGEQFKEAFGRLNESEEVSGIIGSYANHHAAPYSLTEDFVTVYRMHPLIPDEYAFHSHRDHSLVKTADFASINGSRTREAMESLPLEDLFYSFGTSHPGAITLKNYPHSLRDLVVLNGRHVDLATIDNVRDRERALPRYNEFRRRLRMQPIKRWKDITRDPELAEEIRDVYAGDLERVDTMVGLHAETPPVGFGFSDTAFRIFILMASRRLKSDRFYTNDWSVATYTRPGLDWIRDNLMTDVLLRHFPQLGGALNGLGNAFAPWHIHLPAASAPDASRHESPT